MNLMIRILLHEVEHFESAQPATHEAMDGKFFEREEFILLSTKQRIGAFGIDCTPLQNQRQRRVSPSANIIS